MTDSPLDDALPGRHRRIDPADYDDIYVVGDVHGCRETFEALLGELSLGPNDLLVTVGDLVRKGPDSGGVLDIVRVQENVISVRGNNEQHLVSGRKSHPDHGAEDIAFMESLPLAVSWDDTLVVHGGIDHRKPLRAHDRQDLLNMRSLAGDGYERPYWFEAREEGPRVFFGHTVLREPFESPYAVGLDTGCVYGGQLTAYDCGRDRFVSVDPPTTYRDRDEGSIVSPQRASRTA
ncbi:MAG: metallophosphoesterase family protein [Haloarculaceae archaeon]